MHSESQLIKKINKTGNRKAADELIRRYYKEMYAYAYRQTLDNELAQDLTQEIFITMLKGLKCYDGKKASFRTWLYRVASNKITDYFRSRYHKQRILEMDLSELSDSCESISQEMDFIQAIYDEELIQQVMSVIVELGNDWVKIFQMKLFQDLTFSDIAKETGISENTVKTRYYTMLKKLRKEIKR